MSQASQRDGFGPLLDGGIQLHEYFPALLHTKMMIVDGIWATVGSTNFDNRSMAMNDELNVILYDEHIAKGWSTFSWKISSTRGRFHESTWRIGGGSLDSWVS